MRAAVRPGRPAAGAVRQVAAQRRSQLDFGRSYAYQLPGRRGDRRARLADLPARAAQLRRRADRRAAGRVRRQPSAAPLGDNVVRLLTVVGTAVPTWWLGLSIIVLMSGIVGWFPNGQGNDELLRLARHIIIPALLLGLGGLISFTRFVRSEVLEVLEPGLRPDGARQGPGRADGRSARTCCAPR